MLMTIFRQKFVIDAPFSANDAWRRLLAVVQTNPPTCAACGQILNGGGIARFCSSCGRPVDRPASAVKQWAERFLPAPNGRRFEFEGYVSPKEFNITRIIGYRNCCIPVIRGRFEPSNAGTRIAVEMRMHALGYVFLVGGGFISFTVLSAVFYGGDRPPSSGFLYLLPFAAPCFFGLISWLAYAAEAGLGRAALSRVWESAPPLQGEAFHS